MSSQRPLPSSKDSSPEHLDPYQTLSTLLHSRHSIRLFKPDPIPSHLLSQVLHLAQTAPSNSNIQNWRLFLAQGPARTRIVDALRHAATHDGEPNIPALPEKFAHHRSNFGKVLYGPQGWDIPRGETARLREARFRNFEYFGAPVVGVLCMDGVLGYVDALSVGLYAQTLWMGLVAKGLGACLQVSVTGYEEVLRREFGIGEEMRVLCGIAIGWPAEETVNSMDVGRQDVDVNVTILKE